MKYNELSLGQIEAIVNKLGGMEGVSRFLTGELEMVDRGYRIMMDFKVSLKDMVKAGKYAWVNPRINRENFPQTRHGVSILNAHLFKAPLYFGCHISSDSIVAEMGKQGYKPAIIEELLAFGETNPEVQRKFPVVALGSCTGLDRYVPFLSKDISRDTPGRYLHLERWNRPWSLDCQFLAIRVKR